METYANILLYAMPAFLLFVFLEKFYGYYKKGYPIRLMDSISSLSSGFTNIVKDVLGLGFSIITYTWLVDKVAIFEINATVWVYFIAFIAIDFAGYWGHRIDHNVSFFWNGHLVHHSSEEFDLPCALRQSISVFVNIFTIFLLPAALLGVPAQVIAVVAPIQLFSQFWYHTTFINKMGFLENILVTPSHHRVHHAVNEEYLDKNLSQVFIIWDKLFGTFQPELADVPPVYGVTVPVKTWNPIKINFIHLWHIIKDSWRTKNFSDKLKVWYMPPGFRPQDMQQKYPIEKPSDIFEYKKYYPALSQKSTAWVVIQFVFSLFLITIFFLNVANFNWLGMLSFGGFIYLQIYSYTEFMDKNPNAFMFDLFKLVFVGYMLLGTPLWLPVNNFNVIIASMVALSVPISFGFSRNNLKLNKV